MKNILSSASSAVIIALVTGGILMVSDLPRRAEAAPDSVAIASYNVDSAWRQHTDPAIPGWDQRVRGISQIINSAQPDVFGVQEAANINVDGHYYSQAADIGTLTSYVRYQPPDGATVPIPIFYRSSKYNLTGSGFKVFENGGYPNYGRAMTWIRLQSKTSGKSFFVINTHLMVGANNETLRAQESVKLAAEIKRINPTGLPAFVTGDFNATASPAAPQTLQLGKIGFGDSFALTANKVHPDLDTFTGYGAPVAGNFRIDQIYAGAAAEYQLRISAWANIVPSPSQKVGGVSPSDHDMIEIQAIFN